jgi:hypothetical protein
LSSRFELLGWGYADGVGSAGADGAARGGLELLGETDFDSGEEVVAAAECEAGARDRRVGGGEEAEDFGGWHGDLLGERGELGRDGDGAEGGAGGGEEGVGGEAGAGAMGLPLVAEEARVGVDVGELGGVGWTGVGGAMLGPRAGEVLGPEAVEDEGVALCALGGVAVGVTELGRPGEVQEVIVEVLLSDGGGKCAARFGCGGSFRLRRWGIWRSWAAGGEGQENEERGEDSLLHGGSRLSGRREYRTLRDFYGNRDTIRVAVNGCWAK